MSQWTCQGVDFSQSLMFWYDIATDGKQAQSRLSWQKPDSDLIFEKPWSSLVQNDNFSVQSPYPDLQARLSKENDEWVLDLMEKNGDFVIPTYDYFTCLPKQKPSSELSVKAFRNKAFDAASSEKLPGTFYESLRRPFTH